MSKIADKKEGLKLDKYPGVIFDKELNKYIATCMKDGARCVATCDTFEQAKLEMIEFKKD